MRHPFCAALVTVISVWSLSVGADPPKKLKFKWTLLSTYPDKTTATAALAAAGGRIAMQSTSWECSYSIDVKTIDGSVREGGMITCNHNRDLHTSTVNTCVDGDTVTRGAILTVAEESLAKVHLFTILCQRP